MRSETKIFNEWYFKKYGGIISIGTMTGAVLKSWVRKGFDAGWNHRQTEVDELRKISVDLNTETIRQREQVAYYLSKNAELQKQNAWLSGVAERENKRANKLQEEEVSTTSLLGKTIQEKNELQKRVDAVKQLIEEYRDPPTEDKTFCHALSIVAYELEQALKGGCDEAK